MTQQAQSSGHEWILGPCSVRCYECGWKCIEQGTCYEEYKAHVASVAQAAQPQEVPAEQREIGWLVENVDSEWAYCQVKPYRAFKWTRDSVKALRFARREDAESAIMFMQSSESLKATEHSWSGYLAQPASAAKPPFTIQSHPDPLGRTMCTADAIARHGEFHTHELAPETPPEAQGIHAPAGSVQESSQTAKPDEDELEAQCEKLAEHALRNLESNSQSQLEYNVSSAFADFIAARERELRDKLEGWADKWEIDAPPAVKELRALLASHWPAQKEDAK